MDKIKSILFLVVVLVALVTVGYWAFRTLEPGDIHAQRRALEELQEENEALKGEVEDLKGKLAAATPVEGSGEVAGEESVTPTPQPTPTPTPTPASSSNKYQGLINELEDLVKNKIQMKVGSKGTRVGTVQEFLNIYFGTNKKIDNDYGKTTKTDVANFQKKEGLSPDGEAGPATFQKMIDWLEKQG